MEILKTKIAIMGSELTILRNSEIKTLANRARYRIDLFKCIKSNKTVVNG
jgi:hypothetical protein